MVHFVICGKINCPRFAHVSFVADYLEERLPNFVTKRVTLTEQEWPFWLTAKNSENNWHHASSPLVYKHLVCFGGDSHYIGGISEFWEYCYDYYGIECNLSSEELDNIIEGKIKAYEANLFHGELENQKARNVLIYGKESLLLFTLLPELFKIKGFCHAHGLKIFLFHPDKESFNEEDIEELRMNFHCKIERVLNMHTCLPSCDIILITEDFKVSPKGQGLIDMLVKVHYMAEQIHDYGKRHMKIVFANNGYSCFAATILADRVDNPNIVVVSSDRGLAPLNAVASRYNLKTDQLAAPPVWGFIGCNEFIDVQSIIKISNIYKPYKRAITSKEDSTLIQGTIVKELKMIKYIIEFPHELMKYTEESCKMINATLKHEPIYQKVRATTSLLEHWYSPTSSDAIISMGIMSDGSFYIPAGLIFSQPAILDGNRWVPYPNYPISQKVVQKIKSMGHETLAILKGHNLLPRRFDRDSDSDFLAHSDDESN